MRTKCHGFTLAEVTVFAGLGSMLLIAIGSMFFFATRSMIALGNYNDLNQKSRNALDVLTRDVRGTRQVKDFDTDKHMLLFEDYDGVDLRFEYYPDTQRLIKEKAGVSEVLLTECDFLEFHLYQRNPTNNFTFYATSEPDAVKLIDVSWKCSRMILGGKVNTESVQTAKIVIRN